MRLWGFAAMRDRVRQAAWKGGVNNRDDYRKVPDGSLRDAFNVDVAQDGSLSLRLGSEVVYTGTDVRGALAVGDRILIADGDQLIDFDTRSQVPTVLATIAGAGRLVGAVHNEELFFCTENQALRYRAGRLRRWGVPTVSVQPLPVVVAGGMQPGVYQVAMTWLNEFGEEGGTTSAAKIVVGTGQGLSFDLPSLEGHTPLLYVSAPDGATLYLQDKGAGQRLVNVVRDDTARLETMHLREPSPGDCIASRDGVLAISAGSTVWLTEPLRPYLLDRAKRFFQYPTSVGFVASGSAGLIVSAEKTYLIASPESAEPAQGELLPYPGVPGTNVELPDGRIAWMTQYGLAAEVPGGGAQLIGDQKFVPAPAVAGATTVLESEGNQRAISTMRPGADRTPLAVSDHYEAEIVYP